MKPEQTRPVRVIRNPNKHHVGRWWVSCTYCTGDGRTDFLAMLTSYSSPLGWSRTWREAQDFATRHALEHEATRCTACLHVPAEPVASTPKGVKA